MSVKLELIVEEVVRRVLSGENPNDVIVKIASADPNLTDEHVKRIIEGTNVRLFQEHFKQGVYEFDVADPKVIFEKLGRNKGMEKEAYSFSPEDYDVTFFELEFFSPVMEKSACGDNCKIELKKKTQPEQGISKEAEKEMLRLAALAKIRRLIEEGENYKIPKIEKIAHLLSRTDLLNLEFKKYSGFEESEELADEILRLSRYLR